MNQKLTVSLVPLAVFATLWLVFRLSHRRTKYFYFDPQDYSKVPHGERILPTAAATSTFEPMLKHYLGVTQLLVTVAAASIAFAGNNQSHGTVVVAKLILAWSIFFGVIFCALLLWRYDEYSQNMTSYTVSWYATIFASGFSSLACFMAGYLLWGLGT